MTAGKTFKALCVRKCQLDHGAVTVLEFLISITRHRLFKTGPNKKFMGG
jgi:hypothetical protein